ncbi:MAG: hypothetical protein WCG47_28375 [Dermatophilaceae bacterium]
MSQRLSSLARLGYWSAIGVVIFSLGFSASALLGAAGVSYFPWDPIVPDAASLLLAGAFVVMMSSLHGYAGPAERHWTRLGLVFGVMYAALVSIVYFVTLTVVVPLTQQGRAEEVRLLQFNDQGSFMQAVDGLGYFFMSVATFVAAFAFSSPGQDRWVRRVFLVNGILGVPILIAYMPLVVGWSQVLLPVNALWILSVPACGAVASRYFRRNPTGPTRLAGDGLAAGAGHAYPGDL